MDLVLQKLKQYWGFDSFRNSQREIIDSVLEGNDTIALLPTGGGKSLCYQLPALCLSGLTVVISPLIALMRDQVSDLKSRGIAAEAFNSTLNRNQSETVLNNLRLAKIKLLFLSPEKFKNEQLKQILLRQKVSLLVVDEAHCVSQWGHDFRPEYLSIDAKPFQCPIIALTATANNRCLEDIKTYLAIANAKIFRSSFLRKNLVFVNFKTSSKRRQLLEFLEKIKGTAIVYVRSRRLTKELSHFLKGQGITAQPYNGGMQNKDRLKVQENWTKNKTRVAVATNAFGMGIDKGDVKLVVHFEPPPTLEDYYQEAGRAGRNGKKAYAIIMHNESDQLRLKKNFDYAFPEINQLKNFLIKLYVYLDIPLGYGKEKLHFISLRGLSDGIQEKPKKCFYFLKLLQKLEVLKFNDHFFQPTEIFIKQDRRRMFELYEKNPEVMELLQVLLRSYEGLFTDFVRIDLAHLSKSIDQSEESIRLMLTRLDKENIVNLKLRTKKPCVIFKDDRPPKDHIRFDTKKFDFLKEIAGNQLEAMIGYLDSSKCRQGEILKYLDEPMSKPCGVCDVCLGSNDEVLNSNEEQKIIEEIKQRIASGSDSLESIVSGYPYNRRNKIIALLERLSAEQLIENKGGRLYIK
jgi:ATP-dependent DNA helicase RecQ